MPITRKPRKTLICNQQVIGSSPTAGSLFKQHLKRGLRLTIKLSWAAARAVRCRFIAPKKHCHIQVRPPFGCGVQGRLQAPSTPAPTTPRADLDGSGGTSQTSRPPPAPRFSESVRQIRRPDSRQQSMPPDRRPLTLPLPPDATTVLNPISTALHIPVRCRCHPF
jgi:hypothetical protein